jgi:hypothetical protein
MSVFRWRLDACVCANCQNVMSVLRLRLHVCVDPEYQNVISVLRTDVCNNFSVSSYMVHQGEAMHICLFAWYRSGIIQRIWTIHCGGGMGWVFRFRISARRLAAITDVFAVFFGSCRDTRIVSSAVWRCSFPRPFQYLTLQSFHSTPYNGNNWACC